MKKVIMMLVTALFMVGCATNQENFRVAHQNSKWYQANNDNCPMVEFHKNDSITCYSNDMVKLRTIQPVTEDYVRQYRAKKETTKEHRRMELEAQRAFRRINTNSNLVHL